ncbi:MAG: hypothetical protein HC893_10815 [Chloroflexaceae bacterium]|nr:hypothetical protein [Chloroflexaceae bacterium]
MTLSDPLPIGLDVVSADPRCTVTGTTVECALGTLASGANTTVTLVVDAVLTLAGAVVNTASVTGNELDPNTDNNTATQHYKP